MVTSQRPSGTLQSSSPDPISPQTAKSIAMSAVASTSAYLPDPLVFHRTPCVHTFHFYLGDPLTLVELNEKEGTFKLTCIGPNVIMHDHQLQRMVPPNVWFSSIPTKDYAVSSSVRDAENHYSLVGCTCVAGFHYEDLELSSFLSTKIAGTELGRRLFQTNPFRISLLTCRCSLFASSGFHRYVGRLYSVTPGTKWIWCWISRNGGSTADISFENTSPHSSSNRCAVIEYY